MTNPYDGPANSLHQCEACLQRFVATELSHVERYGWICTECALTCPECGKPYASCGHKPDNDVARTREQQCEAVAQAAAAFIQQRAMVAELAHNYCQAMSGGGDAFETACGMVAHRQRVWSLRFVRDDGPELCAAAMAKAWEG